MRWCFWKKKSKAKSLKPIPNVTSIGLIIGHTKSDKGAAIYNNAIQEYDYWKEVASKLVLDKEFAVGFRDNGGVKGACEEIKGKLGHKPDIILELHFNAYNGKAKGCEALYIDSKELAEKFCKFMEHKGKKNRGAKDVYANGRGIKNMEIASKYADNVILTEMFFADNKDDYITIKDATKYLQEFLNWL